MLPNFHTGDIVIARAADDLEIGDVVVYAVPEGAGAGKLVMHRLIGVEADGTLVIQGDNREAPDQFAVTSDDVVGVARVHLPRAGLLVRYMGTWWFIAIAISLFVFVQLWPDDDEGRAGDGDDVDDEHGDAPGRSRAGRLTAAPVLVATVPSAGSSKSLGSPGSRGPSASSVSRVFVDGEAAMEDLWGDLAPDVARRRCLDLCTAGANTFGTRITVVFRQGTRGADIGRVDPRVLIVADGRSVRELAQAVPRGPLDPVQAVVVTSDAHVHREVHAAGAATISCRIWQDLIIG
jgi:hypothetical protein